MTEQALVQALLRLHESGQDFEFIAAGHRAFAAVGATRVLAPLMLRRLIELGLGGPARELLQWCPELRAAGEEEQLDAQLARLPRGDVPWAELASTFQRNAAALCVVRPELRSLVEALPEQLAPTQLFRTKHGAYYLSRRGSGGRREWHCQLTATAADAHVSIPPRGKLGPTAVVGLRAGGLIERIHADTARLFLDYSHPVYLVEPDLLRLGGWLHVADLTTLLSDERVRVFVGDAAASAFQQTLLTEEHLAPPGLFVNQAASVETTRDVHDAAARVCQSREQELARLQAALAERYCTRDIAYWAQRWRRPGCVLGITSRFTTVLQYAMRDALEALGRLGWRTEMIIEAKDHHQFSQLEVCRRILERDPDLIVLLDHLRCENPYLPKNLPLLTWIQDPLPNLLCPQAGASIGPLDFACGYYEKRCTTEFGYRPDRFISTVFPISETTFHDGPLAPEDARRYACDVCFVSNASEPIERFHASSTRQFPKDWRPLLDEIYAQVCGQLERNAYLSYDADVPRLVRETAAAKGIALDAAAVEQVTNQYAYRVYDWGRRQQTLGWAADWARRSGRTFRIYGRGWENHPTLAPFAGGVLEHGEPLRCAYRAAGCVLQLIPTGFRHQRSFEVLASGALPLARYCGTDFMGMSVADFVRHRDRGGALDWASGMFPRLERVVFNGPDEFAALADRFLADPVHRRKVIDELRAVVLRDHTFTAVMGQVMDFIRDGLSAGAEAGLVASAS